MQRGLRWLGLVVLLAFVMPAIGADEKADKKADTTKKAPEKSKYIAYGQPMLATVISVDDKTVKLAAKVPFRQGGRLLYRDQEVEFEAAEDVKVRIEVLPPKVDEDGKKLKRTAAEIKELKGDSTLWGYTGAMENVQAGRNVRFYLGKPRGGEKDDPPLITMIHVAKMPGDDKVEAGVPGFGPGTGEKKPKEGKEGETEELVAFGAPFVAMYARTEGDSTIHLIRQNRVFNQGKIELKDFPAQFEAADSLKIRIESPPPELDDNGKLKKFTKEELKELKGENEKEWGYTGTVDNLQPGRIVKVFLAKPKGADKTDPPVIAALHVAREPGDARVDPEELVFIEKKTAKKNKDDENKDDEKDKKKEKEDEDRPPPYSRPFIATVARVEGLRVFFTVKERVLNGTKVELRDKNVEYSVVEGVKIRLQEPALAFDDKGAVKKYTPEELKEMKGPEGLWGFPTDMEAVQAGRRVKVFLGKFPDDKREAPVILQIFIAKPPKTAE
jgi:hypothetical protein